MADQAEKLRNLVGKKSAQTIGIVGAKGGIGRTSLCANLAMALCKADQRVCALDLDFRLSNLSILFNERPRWNLAHILEDDLSALEALHPTKQGPLLLGGSHNRSLIDLDLMGLQELLQHLNILKESFDFILVDTPGELSSQAEALWEWVDHLLLITTPEPPALVGSYALTRRLVHLNSSVFLVANRCQSKRQEREILDLICRASDEMIDFSIQPCGGIPEDHRVYEALCRRQLYLSEFPRTAASKATQRLAYQILTQEEAKTQKKGIFSLFSRIV